MSFIGSSLAGSISYLPSVCFGIVLCLLLALAVHRRYYEINPSVFYSMVFLAITAIVVSGLRSDLGVVQSLASRYRINSNLFLILAYMFITETFLKDIQTTVWRKRGAIAAVTIICCTFCAVSDRAGYHLLMGRRQAVRFEMARFQHPVISVSSSCFTDPVLSRQIDAGTYKPDAAVLLESEHLGIYFPENVSRSEFSGVCQ